jgi:phage gp36-like protein
VSYSTPAMVRLALVPSCAGFRPSPKSNTAADLEDSQLNDAIAEADSTIETYISGYYATPVANTQDSDGNFTVVPHPVDFWSRNIAVYNATLVYRGGQDFADTDPIARRFTGTMNALVAVSKGSINLELPLVASSDNSRIAVGNAVNPYSGTLWDACSFGIGPRNDFDGRGMWRGW